jgi:nucleoside-diphosphate-sugar epimerase
VVTIGFPYSGILWRDVWPKAISNFVTACKMAGARMVFMDDLYMYGPQTTPLTETMSLSNYGLKPAARSAATRVWMAAAAAGEARVAALRAPDFYGPGVGLSFLGDTSIGKLAQGKPAIFVGSPGVLHDYAYVPDIARAVTTLLAAPDSAFGQGWHMPCAPTRTTRDILQIAADTLDVKLRIRAMPAWMLGPSAMFSPFLRELKEMRFQWDRPYQVDASRFKAAFWSDVTPFETGVPETARAFRAELKERR